MYKTIKFNIKCEEELEKLLENAISISTVVEYNFGDYQIKQYYKQSYFYRKENDILPVSQRFFDLALLLNIKERIYCEDIVEYLYKSEEKEYMISSSFFKEMKLYNEYTTIIKTEYEFFYKKETEKIKIIYNNIDNQYYIEVISTNEEMNIDYLLNLFNLKSINKNFI